MKFTEEELDQGIAENLRLGYMEILGHDDKGEPIYRMTEKGEEFVKNMHKRDMH